ncbi:MAG: CopG family transcriptional regulator [Candidatus Azobacteroides sp.]|nr:CopG family transcriptional regulator [Candidatus Azobacteroides sp.]
MEIIKVLVGWSNKNYSATTDDYNRLNGIVIATGVTFEGLQKEFESALKFHIEGCLADGDSLPEWLLSGNYKLEYELATSALLHSLDGILTRSAIARVSGINERQIGHYALGIRNPRPEKRKQIIDGIHQISRELASVV